MGFMFTKLNYWKQYIFIVNMFTKHWFALCLPWSGIPVGTLDIVSIVGEWIGSIDGSSLITGDWVGRLTGSEVGT